MRRLGRPAGGGGEIVPVSDDPTVDRATNAQPSQAEMWNGRYGQAWVEAQEMLDPLWRPLEDHLAEAVGRRPSAHVLDIGCGTGATTVAAARRTGARGSCSGIDVSAPMLAVARERAEREGVAARFVLADAETHPFDPAAFDLLISRFGVMFFADPVAAFANLRRAAADEAELRLLVWRGPAENPFMTTAERAAGSLLPLLPPRPADAPGQFALADPDRTARILADSGWSAIDIQPHDIPCTLPESQLVRFFSQLGPVGRALQDADEPTRAQVIPKVRTAFDPYVEAGKAHFTAALWQIVARA